MIRLPWSIKTDRVLAVVVLLVGMGVSAFILGKQAGRHARDQDIAALNLQMKYAHAEVNRTYATLKECLTGWERAQAQLRSATPPAVSPKNP